MPIINEKFIDRYLGEAVSLSSKSDFTQFKIGSILVNKGKIISSGYNKKKSHPMQYKLNQHREEHKRNRNFIHAEFDSLNGLNEEFCNNSILFLGRTDRNGNPAICRPCQGCMFLIRQLSIDTIVYSTNIGYNIERIL